jgi:tetratricopeptide (TPR) repeat protein
MILGAGFYATQDHLQNTRKDDPLLYIENLAALAHALENVDASSVAVEAFRRLIAVVEESGPEGSLHNALLDMNEFALNHHEYASDGIRAAERLLEESRDAPEIATLRLDLADFHDAAGQPDVADRLYREMMAEDPPEAFCHLRWARRLAEAGNSAEAESVYRKVMERKGMDDPDAPTDAAVELAELLEKQGRIGEAADLRKRLRPGG